MNTIFALFIGPLYKKSSQKKEELPSDIPCFLVDGGNKFFKKNSPNVLRVGDGDSYKGKLDIKLPVQKDISDLGYALSLVDKKARILFLKGFLGKRRDHELFNLGEVHAFLKKKAESLAFFDDELIFFSKGSYEIELKGLFSIACLEKTKVSLQGQCLYKLRDQSLMPLSSLGLSNEGKGKITLKTSAPLFILISGKAS